MADTDVVKHELLAAGPAHPINWDQYIEPIPFPSGGEDFSSQNTDVVAEPPVTTLVTDEERIQPPYRSVGRMVPIFQDNGYSGTGWVVSKRAFITAGHCVYYHKFGGWLDGAEFAPRYNKGHETLYTVEAVFTFKGWIDSQKRAFDMAACLIFGLFEKTEPPLKFDTSIFPSEKYTAIGYPCRPIANHNFNGERMWKSVGDYIKMEHNLQWASNNLTAGASGGPWCDVDNNFEAAGLTSSRKDNLNEAVSPMFSNGFQNLYDAVKDL